MLPDAILHLAGSGRLDEEIAQFIQQFLDAVPSSGYAFSLLHFDPADPSLPSAEEIVDKALSYKPLEL